MHRKIRLTGTALLLLTSVYAQRYGGRKPYFQNGILPTAGDRPPNYMDHILDSCFSQWRGRYIKRLNNTDQSYIREVDNEHPKVACVSESQGFGMVIVALMGKRDTSLRLLYDSLYLYYAAHPSRKTVNDGRPAHLMAEGMKLDGSFKNCTAATDCDIDIAYSLLLADQVWAKDQPVNYKVLARSLIESIMTYEVNQFKWTLFLDDEEFCNDLRIIAIKLSVQERQISSLRSSVVLRRWPKSKNGMP